MSRCARTEALLAAALAGEGPSRLDAEHVASCPQCARALAELRRFEAELHRAAEQMVAEPMTGPAAHEDGGRRGMSTRTMASLAGAAVLLVAVIVGGGQWLGSVLGERSPAPAVGPAAMDAWLDRALDRAIGETAAWSNPEDWEPFQVERCASHAIAFFAQRDGGLQPFRWAIGEPGAPLERVETGAAASLNDADVAAARARLPMCELVIDPQADLEGVRAAFDRAREDWASELPPDHGTDPALVDRRRALFGDLVDSRVVVLAPVSEGRYSVLLEREEGGIQTRLDRLGLLLERDGTVQVEHAAMDLAVAGSDKVYRESSMSQQALFGLVDDARVVAVDLVGRDLHLRYPVTAPGFLLADGVPAEQLREFRLLSRSGEILAEGTIAGWPPER